MCGSGGSWDLGARGRLRVVPFLNCLRFFRVTCCVWGCWLDCVLRVRIGTWVRELNSFSVALGDSAHLHDQVDFHLELCGVRNFDLDTLGGTDCFSGF